MSNPVPLDLQADRQARQVTIVWPDRQVAFPCRLLRIECTCAHCINEWTGERMLDPTTVPADVTVEQMELVGSYAVRIHWSDGHNAGLYTWDRLWELADIVSS